MKDIIDYLSRLYPAEERVQSNSFTAEEVDLFKKGELCTDTSQIDEDSSLPDMSLDDINIDEDIDAVFELDLDVPSPGEHNREEGAVLNMNSSSVSQEELFQLGKIGVRIHSISDAVIRTIENNKESILEAAEVIGCWIKEKSIVRYLGAGRALIAASLSGNRLAHAGAVVSFMGGLVPLPNSLEGGGIISSSASGKTRSVLEAMNIARQNNPSIKILGIADKDAVEFADLCDIFIGIHKPVLPVPDELTALADREELIISELLDAIVVLAGVNLGFDDEAWRRGHEDIGPTGPYSPRKKG